MTDTPAHTIAAVKLPNAPSILEKHGYLFGSPISHSLSPLFHQTIFDTLGLQWSQLFLESLDVEAFLVLIRSTDFFGASVTMPHKIAIIPHLDQLTPEARDINAVNSIYPRTINGVCTLIGTNTDVIGVRLSIANNVPETVYSGKPGLVIGGGGAARSAIYAMRKWLGVTTIYLVNRDDGEAEGIIRDCVKGGFGEDLVHLQTVEETNGEDFKIPGMAVSCIPDIAPSTQEEIVARQVLLAVLGKREEGETRVMLDMCYHPSPWTGVVELSKGFGWEVVLGTEAMLWQGVEQSQLWTERIHPPEVIEKVRAVIADNLKHRDVLKS